MTHLDRLSINFAKPEEQRAEIGQAVCFERQKTRLDYKFLRVSPAQ